MGVSVKNGIMIISEMDCEMNMQNYGLFENGLMKVVLNPLDVELFFAKLL